jgi:hypothetical protein
VYIYTYAGARLLNVDDIIAVSNWLSTAQLAVFVVNAVSASLSRAQLPSTLPLQVCALSFGGAKFTKEKRCSRNPLRILEPTAYSATHASFSVLKEEESEDLCIFYDTIEGPRVDQDGRWSTLNSFRFLRF